MLESLQNKAEDHQIKNQGRSIAEITKSFGDFLVFFFYHGKLIFSLFMSDTFAEMSSMIKSQERMRRRIKERKTLNKDKLLDQTGDQRINIQSK